MNTKGFVPGAKVVCINDQGWLNPDSPSPNPKKGLVYVLKTVEYRQGLYVVSLLGFPDYSFYLARRFRLLDELKAEAEQRQKTCELEPASGGTAR